VWPLHFSTLRPIVCFIRIFRVLGTRWIGGTTRAGSTTAVDQHHSSLDSNPRRPDIDEISRSLNGDFHSGLDYDVHAGLQVNFCARLVGKVLARLFLKILADLKPEAAYFLAESGRRTGILIMNMDDASQIPALAEPWFLALNAAIEVTPVMLPEDLAKAGPAIEQAVKTFG